MAMKKKNTKDGVVWVVNSGPDIPFPIVILMAVTIATALFVTSTVIGMKIGQTSVKNNTNNIKSLQVTDFKNKK